MLIKESKLRSIIRQIVLQEAGMAPGSIPSSSPATTGISDYSSYDDSGMGEEEYGLESEYSEPVDEYSSEYADESLDEYPSEEYDEYGSSYSPSYVPPSPTTFGESAARRRRNFRR
jgi:hypothetical protein